MGQVVSYTLCRLMIVIVTVHFDIFCRTMLLAVAGCLYFLTFTIYRLLYNQQAAEWWCYDICSLSWIELSANNQWTCVNLSISLRRSLLFGLHGRSCVLVLVFLVYLLWGEKKLHIFVYVLHSSSGTSFYMFQRLFWWIKGVSIVSLNRETINFLV